MRNWLKARLPYLYWKARNGAALAKWCSLQFLPSTSGESDSYDDDFWSLHDCGDWEGFGRLIVEHFRPNAVWDVGCGDGKMLASLAKVAPAANLVGFDHSPVARGRAAARGAIVLPFDLAKLTPNAVRATVSHVGSPDLCVCLEVAEHLPFWHANTLLRLLTAAPVVVFSAAQPLQGGVLHMNEQRPEYWVRKFGRVGYSLSTKDADFRSAVSALSLPAWYGQNVQVFVRLQKN